MITFANLSFKCLAKDILLREETSLKFIVTVNSEHIVNAAKNEKLKKIINENFATFDGQIPYALAKRKNKGISFEKLSGSDIIYDMCSMASEQNKKVFLLGGYETSNTKSVMKLRQKYPSLDIDGYSPPHKQYPFDTDHNDMILSKVQNFNPSILFVGFGAVKQEYWINDNKSTLESMGIKWVMGSGGTFEFVAGTFKRAPLVVQRIGMEAIWRFLNEPKWFRLKRILVSLLVFRHV